MTFKASLKEIDNGFLVEVPGSKWLEYSEIHAPTFDMAVALVVTKYAESHPSVTVATPLMVPVTVVHPVRVPEKARKKPLLKERSSTVRYVVL